ncbi:MAG: hypothetical protein IPG64_25000 [Haliea sp.]|nr:hypothetical protein [Haliea sp.]
MSISSTDLIREWRCSLEMITVWMLSGSSRISCSKSRLNVALNFPGFRSRDAIIPEKVIERIIAETVGGDRPAVHWSRALQEMKTSLSEFFSIQVQ